MASTCFGHLYVQHQEFLYIGCFTAACGVMPSEKTRLGVSGFLYPHIICVVLSSFYLVSVDVKCQYDK